MAISDNNILLFAPEATGPSSDVITSATTGQYYLSETWKNNLNRQNGVKQGVASSIEYNTVLRQCAFASRLFAEMLAERFNTILAPDNKSGVELDGAITAAVNTITSSWIKPAEIDATKLAKDAVVTDKILNKTITANKLNDVVDTTQKSVNGISVSLRHRADNKIELSINSDSVDKADSLLTENVGENRQIYLMGHNDSATGYKKPYISPKVYITAEGVLKAPYMEATSYNATSDIRLKTNIKTSDIKATKIVEDIDVVDFEYKSNEGVKQIGVIAQALQSVCPDMVITGEDGYLRIKESKLVYILWKALQESNERISELENKLANK